MTVGELISKIPDSYVELAINEYDGLDHTGRRYTIERHSTDYTHIPEDIWNKEVRMIVPYYDRISIEVEKEA